MKHSYKIGSKNRRSHYEPREISLRAYVPPPKTGEFERPKRPPQGPSEFTLIFDTETTINASQCLRFGAFQLRKAEGIFRAGIFIEPETLTSKEIAVLKSYASTHDLDVMTVGNFVEDIFFGIAYDLRATIVGFNLPFDFSRLAIRHGSARSKFMRSGFTLTISKKSIVP